MNDEKKKKSILCVRATVGVGVFGGRFISSCELEGEKEHETGTSGPLPVCV
jgi:hypothetical protein